MAAPKLAILAHSLSANVERFEIRDRRFAADLATRAIEWPTGDGKANRHSMLADCELVLAASRTADGATKHNIVDANPTASNPKPPDEPVNLSLPALARLPGGGLPVEIASLPKKIAELQPARSPVASVEPNRLPEEIASRPIHDEMQPPRANEPRRLPDDNGPTARLSHSEIEKTSATQSADWSHMEFRAVLRELRSADYDSVAKAERELRRRGVTGRLLELARRAADPDPHVRQGLAETLPDLPGVDARPWLLELSYDENPKVRAAAVTLMATSGDLELLRRVRQVSLDDPDDYTRAQAEKALPKQRR
jgi:hypothetical protein